MSETKYLAFVLEKLQEKIAQVSDKVVETQQDLDNMNDYFWESFHEFDEYGYEEYDNQTAYKMRAREQENHIDELKRYKKMLNSPYFGKIRFTYEGESEPENFYIGIGNLWEDDLEPLIFDWRAPVSALFYDYEKGPAQYEAPVGILKGEINQKMQFKIKHGKMIYGIESDLKIDDDILKSVLAEHADAKLKSIVASIQREQNEIIRNKEDKVLIIQGCAGSGKTSIALHRIAYLLYHNRDKLSAADILILSPNNIFADYISHILPELGEENIMEMSFDTFAYHELKNYGETEDFYDHLEARILNGVTKEDGVRQKHSKEFCIQMNEFVLKLESDLMNFRDFHYGKISKTSDFFVEMFYEKFPDIPLMKRMDSIAEYVIDEVETLYGFSYSEEQSDEIKKRMRNMYRTKKMKVLYREFLQTYGYHADLKMENKIPYEDVYPMIYLKYLLWGSKKRRVKHLVIDEMQDYSYLQYQIIAKLFSCPMTILGDKAQCLDGKVQDVREFLREVLHEKGKMIELKKSYRSTYEIMEFARQFGNGDEVIPFTRNGKKPEVLKFVTEDEKYERLAYDIRNNKSAETIAVLTLSQKQTVLTADKLKDRMDDSEIHILNKDSTKFGTGIYVMPYYLAKGLEFDSVVVADGENMLYETPFGRQALYVCATRALHTFDIYTSSV